MKSYPFSVSMFPALQRIWIFKIMKVSSGIFLASTPNLTGASLLLGNRIPWLAVQHYAA